MMETMAQLCEILRLGEITQPLIRVYGGYLHMMYQLETVQGKYAVKQLNLEIMKRETAMSNYLLSEKFARLALKRQIHAVCALQNQGNPVIELSGCYYMVFNWIEGEVLQNDVLDSDKARKIGEALAQIHSLDSRDLVKPTEQLTEPIQPIDWIFCATLWEDLNLLWLKSIEDEANHALPLLAQHQVLSHRDLDKKNVLWSSDNQPIIIDWESVGMTHPLTELIDVAINWSVTKHGDIDKATFDDMIMCYLDARKIDITTILTDISLALSAGYKGRLEWLVYNLKRSAGLEVNNTEEIALGKMQVIETLLDLKNYSVNKEKIELWLTLM